MGRLCVVLCALLAGSVRATELTAAKGEWLLDGKPVNEGSWSEGLLLSAYTIQGVFDDENKSTRSKWAYPDTKSWDPARNTDELAAALPSYVASGVSAITIGLQGGCPVPECNGSQPWKVSAFTSEGELKKEWTDRLLELEKATDSAGMAMIVTLFYQPQLDVFSGNDSGVLRAVEAFGEWVQQVGAKNVLVDVVDTSAPSLPHPLTLSGLPSTLQLLRHASGKNPPLATATVLASTTPPAALLKASDFVLLKAVTAAGGDADVQAARENAKTARAAAEAAGIGELPIVYAQGGTGLSGMRSAVSVQASWGLMEEGKNDHSTGLGCPPVRYTPMDPARELYFKQAKRMAVKLSLPPSPWPTASPSEVGMDEKALEEVAGYVKGHGCLVRDGKQVFEWPKGTGCSQRNDVASAAKVVYSYFLWRAVESKMVPSVDTPIVNYMPELASLNPPHHKDRNITFHHMANQISCYGVSEWPGTGTAH